MLLIGTQAVHRQTAGSRSASAPELLADSAYGESARGGARTPSHGFPDGSHVRPCFWDSWGRRPLLPRGNGRESRTHRRKYGPPRLIVLLQQSVCKVLHRTAAQVQHAPLTAESMSIEVG